MKIFLHSYHLTYLKRKFSGGVRFIMQGWREFPLSKISSDKFDYFLMKENWSMMKQIKKNTHTHCFVYVFSKHGCICHKDMTVEHSGRSKFTIYFILNCLVKEIIVILLNKLFVRCYFCFKRAFLFFHGSVTDSQFKNLKIKKKKRNLSATIIKQWVRKTNRNWTIQH